MSVSTSQTGFVDLGISFRFLNTTSRWLYLNPCAASLERSTAAGWQLEVGRTCGRNPASNLRPPVPLAPAEVMVDTSFAHVILTPGRYRAVFYTRKSVNSGDWQPVYSNSFDYTRSSP